MAVPVTHSTAAVAAAQKSAMPADPRDGFDREFGWPIPKRKLTEGQERPLVGENLNRVMRGDGRRGDGMLGGL